jgi:hypothetical protein
MKAKLDKPQREQRTQRKDTEKGFTRMDRMGRIKDPVITRKPPQHSKRSDLPYPENA